MILMREILFRGKAINREDGFNYRTNYKNGDWVYGLLTKNYNEEYDFAAEMTNEIGISGIEVDYKTIGQYTGYTDKNGVRIFEGDIVNYFGKDFLNSLVTFDKGSFWFEFLSEYTRKIRDQKRDLIFANVSLCGEVIGNQYDNPELVEGYGKE
jgi:uncharacterized phage protein (TIGR01671 family)